GHSHDLTPRLRRQASSDQRARARCGFDHHRPCAQSSDDPVAVREVPRARLGSGRHFREHETAFVQRLLPRLVLGRVVDLAPASSRGYSPCPKVTYFAPSFSTAAISRSAWSRPNSLGGVPPPRRARSGTASSAAAALPNRAIS